MSLQCCERFLEESWLKFRPVKKRSHDEILELLESDLDGFNPSIL
jgi:hypothetical protein